MEDKKQFDTEAFREICKEVFTKYGNSSNQAMKNSSDLIEGKIVDAIFPTNSPCLGCQFSTWSAVYKDTPTKIKTIKESFIECHCSKKFATTFSTNLINFNNSVFTPACSGNPDFKKMTSQENVKEEVIELETDEQKKLREENERELLEITAKHFEEIK